MKPTWTDATSYSRDERGKVEPRQWQLDLDGIRLIVHRCHSLEGWWGTCHAMGVERIALGDDLEIAKAGLLAHCKGRADNWLKKLRKVTP